MIRALIVDDDALVARTMGRMLSRHPDVVDVVDAVCDADTAMRRLEVDPIDVVITDLDLGYGKTGMELAAEVRRQFPSIRIIMVSGSFGAPADGGALSERGVVDAFLPKPVQVTELVERLRGIERTAAPAGPS